MRELFEANEDTAGNAKLTETLFSLSNAKPQTGDAGAGREAGGQGRQRETRGGSPEEETR